MLSVPYAVLFGHITLNCSE